MSYKTVRLTGTYLFPDGAPISGSVDIIPSEPVIKDDAGNVIIAGRAKHKLVERTWQRVDPDTGEPVVDGEGNPVMERGGSFAVDLPATDDLTLTPTGFGFTASPKILGGRLDAVSFYLPAAVPEVDMTDVTQVLPSTFAPDFRIASADDVEAVEGRVAELEAAPAPVTSWEALEGKPDIPATAEDVGALPADEVVPDGNLPERLSEPGLSVTFARGVSLREPRFGVVGNGVANDTAAVQAALDAATAAGTWLYAPPGTYRVSGIVLADNATIIGAGSELTTFKLPDGGSGEVFISQGFAGLTGGGSDAGVSGVSLVGFTIHGNRAADTAGTWGLRKFGYRWRLRDIIVRDCGGGGIYSEWGHEPGAGDDGDFMEDLLSEVRVHECNGMGVQWRGPHDTRMEQVLIYANAGIGLSIEGGTAYHAGGILLDSVHSYGNGGHGVQVISPDNTGADIYASTLVSESNGGAGLLLDSNGSVISSGSFYANGGHGIDIAGYSAGYSIGAVSFNNAGAQIKFTQDGGNAVISLATYTAVASQFGQTGTPHDSTVLLISGTGNGSNNTNGITTPGTVTTRGYLQGSGVAYYGGTAKLHLPTAATTDSGYVFWDEAEKRVKVGADAGVSKRIVSDEAESTANLASKAHAVNTVGKYAGKVVYNYNLMRPVWSTGSTATATWVYADGTTAHTPA